MGDLLYLLKWLRREGVLIHLERDPEDDWFAEAEDATSEHGCFARTPLRALRALAQQIRQQEGES